MKLPFLIAAVMAGVLLTPFDSDAQQGPSQLPSPHQPSSPMAERDYSPYRSGSALPNRRIPSLTSPRQDETRPFTPDEAWPKTGPGREPQSPSLPPDKLADEVNKTFQDPGQPSLDGSLKDSGTDMGSAIAPD